MTPGATTRPRPPTLRGMRARSIASVMLPLALLTGVAACGDGSDSGLSVGGADDPDVTGSVVDPPDGSSPSSDSSDPPGASTEGSNGSESPAGDPFGWEEIDDGIDVGTLDVPLDYDDPSHGTIELYVVRHRATDPDERIGSLLVNPGGPGFGGSYLAQYAPQIYDRGLVARFDIIGWDPRGTGLSEPAVDCIDDYDEMAGGDITPDTPDEREELIESAREFAEACEANSGDILAYVGTNNSAADMDSIRQALGEDKISYFGFSYGSELGATWATLFPDTVRAAVLDGASDPNADPDAGLVQQSAGFEGTLTTFLAECSADDDCAFHNGGDAEGAFDAFMADLDENPIPTESGRPDLTRGMALTAVAQAMYTPQLWDQLAEALADGRDGDGSGLLELYDSYYQRNPDGTYGNELEAFIAIGCVDDASRPTPDEADEIVPELNAAAPRFSPNTTGDYSCSFWPVDGDQRATITGVGAGPIVVIGTTGDPATPLVSTEAMAEALEDGRLVIVEADQHTGYGVNDCIVETVNSYLIDLVPPPDGILCD